MFVLFVASLDPCQSFSCNNQGTVENINDVCTCDCNDGYSGDHCETQGNDGYMMVIVEIIVKLKVTVMDDYNTGYEFINSL